MISLKHEIVRNKTGKRFTKKTDKNWEWMIPKKQQTIIFAKKI